MVQFSELFIALTVTRHISVGYGQVGMFLGRTHSNCQNGHGSTLAIQKEIPSCFSSGGETVTCQRQNGFAAVLSKVGAFEDRMACVRVGSAGFVVSSNP
jgi:hypothetical protein